MITLSGMRDHANYLIGGFTDEPVPDSEMNAYINEAGNWYQTNFTDHERRLTPTAAGLTAAALTTDDFSAVTTPTNIRRIMGAYLVATDGDSEASSTTSTQLDKRDPHEIYTMRRLSTTAGTPTRWAAYLKGGTAGAWRVMLHPPISSTARVALYVDEEWIDLATDSSVPDVTPEDAYTIARIAALTAAVVLERERAKIDAIAKLLPEHVRSKMSLHERVLDPRVAA